MTADTLDFGACLSRCVLMGPLREHSFELKGYLLRTNIIPHFVVHLQDNRHRAAERVWLLRGFAALLAAARAPALLCSWLWLRGCAALPSIGSLEIIDRWESTLRILTLIARQL